MTIDEAIKILDDLRFLDMGKLPDGSLAALLLGVNALTRIEEAREKYHSVWGDMLPGETEE